MESELVALDRKPVLPADSLVQTDLWLNIRQVQNGTAAIANKMAVWVGDGVKTLLALDYPHTLNETPSLKKS